MKKCIICGKEAKYQIKGTNNYYCEECAKELFSDLSVLIPIEESSSLNQIESEEIEKINQLKDDQEFFNRFVDEFNEKD